MMETSELTARWRARLESFATVLLIAVTLFVGGTALWDRIHVPPPPTEPPLPSEPVSIDDAPIRGDKNAPIALIEFSDFECPYCGRSARDVLPELDRQYLRAGKVLLAWRHFPLSIHDHARKAAEAAECAGRQGKFWEFHDWAFEHQQELDVTSVRGAAEQLRLDLPSFMACLDNGETTGKVKRDVEIGEGFSVSSTPTWFLGVVRPDGTVKLSARISGAQPLAVFQEAIDEAIVATSDSSHSQGSNY
jgi:protein-disulfide isomerase